MMELLEGFSVNYETGNILFNMFLGLIAGVIMAGILAATMSTSDSQMLATEIKSIQKILY